MDQIPPVYSILLIDDDPAEAVVLSRILSALTEAPITVQHVVKCSEAVRELNASAYDLILLDNRLSERVTGQFSVPFIRSALNQAPIAMISTDVNVPYLGSPTILGVDYIVDKTDMISFIRDRLMENIQTGLYPVRRGRQSVR